MVIALNQKKSNPKTGGEQSVKSVDRNHENGAEKSKKTTKKLLGQDILDKRKKMDGFPP